MDKLNPEVFLTVVQTGSFKAAAQKLGYTQAGIAYIINSMEEEMGLTLFIREYGGVRLSSQGLALLDCIRTLDADERRLEETVNSLKGLKNGRVRVLIFDSISIHWIPGILGEYQALYPGISVELVSVEDSFKAAEMVRTKEVDCGFFLHNPQGSGLEIFPLMEERLQAIVPVGHPVAEKEYFPTAELGSYPYISMAYEEKNGIADIFRSRGVDARVAFRLDNDYAAMAMVSAGHGFCIFPELLLRDVPYELKIMDFDEPVTRTVSIGVKSMKESTLAAASFVECTRRWVDRWLCSEGRSAIKNEREHS